MKKSAFSLVELLITITLVSLIIGVTAPVFTKKLHANSTIVGASESEKENEEKFDCSGEDFYLLKKEDSGLEYDLCITKYNMLTADTEMAMADDAITSAGVTFVAAGESCDASTSACCWGKGNSKNSGEYTSDSTGCSEKNGYGGCYRTICDWDAGVSICEKYNHANVTWRLASSDELKKFSSVSNLISNLNLCDTTNDSTYARCQYERKCTESKDGYCYPFGVWAGNSSGTVSTYYYLSGSNWEGPYGRYPTYPHSIRCVTDMVSRGDEAEEEEEEEEPNCPDFGDDCTECDEDKCLDCSNTCEEGQMLDVEANCECKNCSSVYGDNCIACDNTGCTSCKSGTTLIGGQCSSLYIRVGNLYVTTMNALDVISSSPSDAYLTGTSGFTEYYMYDTNQTYYGTSACWSDSYNCGTDEIIASYTNHDSTCTRTICDWEAADAICKALSLDGKTWRLPTPDELSTFSSRLSDLNLCSATTNSTNYGHCSGFYDCYPLGTPLCSPGYVWSNTASTSDSYTHIAYYLDNNTWTKGGSTSYMPASVRCVSPACSTICSSGQYVDENCECKSCTSKHGEGCDSCNESYCLQCTNGYGPTKDASGNITSCTACTPTNCLRCASGPSVCSQCSSGYYLNSNNTCTACRTGCATCNAMGCLTCQSGYFIDSDNVASQAICLKCSNAISYCEACSNDTTCTKCQDGYYLNGSTCSACATNCATCTGSGSNQCTSCKDGYTLQSDGSCKVDFDCSGDDFYLLTKDISGLDYDLCITKYNMGNSSTFSMTENITSEGYSLADLAGVTYVYGGTSSTECYSASSKCCWGKYSTSTANETSCTTQNGYSGCSRTVCEWDAAQAICDAFNYQDKNWRLPTTEELAKFTTCLNVLNLCNDADEYTSSSYAKCSYGSGMCRGALGNGCYAYNIWSSNYNFYAAGNRPLYYSLSSSSWSQKESYTQPSQNEAFSVRCVTQM